jgi:hypothetical protein
VYKRAIGWEFDPDVTVLPVIHTLQLAPSAWVVSHRSTETVTHFEPVLTLAGVDDDLPTSVVDARAASVSDA